MGDLFQTLVDLDAAPAEADALADRALDWLVAEGIVLAERTDCVLGAPSGNPPGKQWAKAVVDPSWPPTDGLDIETGRTVFHGGQGSAQYATCPRCGGRTNFQTEEWEDIDGAWQPFGDAVDVWYETGEATVSCPRCGVASDLCAWTWADDFFAFAYLGFNFWNWPELSPQFLADIARILGGHRIVKVWGKL